MLIEQPPQLFRCLFPGAVWRKPSEGKSRTVYLTFDDGPIPEATPMVLDILDRFDVKATFFMVGQNVERNPALLDEVIRRGHRAANHSLHHIRGMGIKAEDYLKDVDACARLVGSNLFRPPHGWLSPSQLKAVKEKYKVIMYDLVTRDYSRKISSRQVVENVKRYVRDGSIIVFHDSLKSREKLPTALPESIVWLKNQGYSFGLPDNL